jgi:hypothetical protein
MNSQPPEPPEGPYPAKVRRSDMTVRPSLTEYFGTMFYRVRDNRGVMIALLAVVCGALASMTVMSRGSVSPLIMLPSVLVVALVFLLPTLIYAGTVRLVVTDNNALERRTPWSHSRVEVPRIDLVRYRVSYTASLAGKKFYLGLDNEGRCRFTLRASLWRENDLASLTNRLGGQLRGAWTDVIEVDRVRATFGGRVCLGDGDAARRDGQDFL